MRWARSTVPLTAALIAATALANPAMAAPGRAPLDDVRDASGLVVVGTDAPGATAPSAAAAKVLHAAWELSEANPDDFSYPWVAPTGEVVIDTVTATGRQRAQSLHVGPATGAAQRLRTVTRSFRELEKIKHEAIGLTSANLPDGEAIYETEPDPANNRVVITVQRRTPALLAGLAKRYGTSAIAIRYQPDRPPTMPQGRDNDTSPFYGGANAWCSTGFSWFSGTQAMMISAGHCTPGGGNVSTPVAFVGTVTAGSGENYNAGVGTVLLPDQVNYRGDIALINVTPGSNSSGRIYTGGPGSSTSVAVGAMATELAVVGERYCTGGYASGEMCGWTVAKTRFDHRYSNGEVVRNADQGNKAAPCTIGGDSGGPLYEYRPDGKVTARGIHSGGSTGTPRACFEIFTDIWDPYHAFPGFLAVS